MKQTPQKDFWLELPEPIQAQLQQALEESDTAQLMPHDEVFLQLQKKYNA